MKYTYCRLQDLPRIGFVDLNKFNHIVLRGRFTCQFTGFYYLTKHDCRLHECEHPSFLPVFCNFNCLAGTRQSAYFIGDLIYSMTLR